MDFYYLIIIYNVCGVAKTSSHTFTLTLVSVTVPQSWLQSFMSACSGKPCPPFKIVILDEADSMTAPAQVIFHTHCHLL